MVAALRIDHANRNEADHLATDVYYVASVPINATIRLPGEHRRGPYRGPAEGMT